MTSESYPVDKLYPYDPTLDPRRINEVEGLDRLRYLQDRKLAQLALELHEGSRKRWAPVYRGEPG